MARERSPNRDRAFELWQEHGGKISNREIAAALSEDEKKIAVWKQRDKWSVVQQSSNVVQQKKECCTTKKKPGGQPGNGNAKGHGAPGGNDNAKGNKGGAPLRNGNAIKTGEYQTIWMDYLSEGEREFYDCIDTDKDIQTNATLKNLAFRENLMMKRLFELQDGIDNVETNTVKELISKTVPIEIYDESASQMLIKSTTVSTMQTTKIMEKKKSMLGDILRVEDALTRLQDKKAKFLQTKHRIELDAERLELEYKKINKDNDYEKITKVLHEVLGGTKHNLGGDRND